MSEESEQVEEFRGRTVYRSLRDHKELVGQLRYLVTEGQYFAEARTPQGASDWPGMRYDVLVTGATVEEVKDAVIRVEGDD